MAWPEENWSRVGSPEENWSPLYDPLRSDARFQALMRRIDDDVAAMRRRAGLG
jgi:hypothetical protein